MAATYPNPKNGAFAFASTPSLAGVDFAAFEYGESQATESVACYGSAVYDPHRGSGTPHASATVSAFAKYGLAASFPFSTTGAVTTAGGGSATFTVDTGVTLVGTCIIAGVRLSHARLRAAVPLSFSLEGGGEMVCTWPVT